MNQLDDEEGTDESSRDRVTVGLTQEGFEHLAALKDTRWFDQEMDIYRLAIAVAIDRGLVVQHEEMKNVRTKYNVGSLDSDGRLKAMIILLVPETKDRPYAYAERLAEAGLRYLASRLVAQDALISDVLIHSASAAAVLPSASPEPDVGSAEDDNR